MTSVPPAPNSGNLERQIEWVYARCQAVGRTQARYLLLLLFGSVYAAGVHLSANPTANVQFLGLNVPRCLAETGAVSLLALVTLGFFGAGAALYVAHTELADLLGVDPDKLNVDSIDQHPNLLDFLAYSTFYKGKTTWVTVISWSFLYPLPLLAAFGWAVRLWWFGFSARPYPWPWLIYVHLFNGILLLVVLIRAVAFLRTHYIATAASVREWRDRRSPKP